MRLHRGHTPNPLQKEHQEYLRWIENLSKVEIDPKTKDEMGRNALMTLFEKNSSVSLVYRMVEAARSGNGQISGKSVPHISTNEGIFWEGSENYQGLMDSHRKWIKSQDEGGEYPNPQVTISYNFQADESEAAKYRQRLEDEILQKKLEVARVLIPSLLQAGIDIDAVDNEGKTALVIAKERGDKALKQALLENGANEFDLKKLDPEFSYLTDRADERNISRGMGKWFMLSELISLGIRNRKLGEYPFAKLNEDNSISFFTESEFSGNPRSAELAPTERIKMIKEDFVTEQLRYQARKFKFPIIGDGDILEIKEGEGAASDVIEYKLNLSPRDLDAILMQNDGYRGYRNSGGESVLSLCKNFTMKDGAIMLFPAFMTEEDRELLVQAAGCQYCEMPSLQLMHLLPNYKREIAPRHEREGLSFHWLPGEVADALCLDRTDILQIILKILSDNGIAVSENGDESIPKALRIEDGDKLKTLRVVEIDQSSRDFYSLYGNLSEEALVSLKSVEVGTDTFLAATQECLKNKTASSPKGRAKLDSAQELIQEMIVARSLAHTSKSERPTFVQKLRNSTNSTERNDQNQNR